MIQVEKISKTYSSAENGSFYALEDVSFEVHKGEVLGLIGLSGAGKSTALRSINLLERPDSGKVFFHGQNILEKSPAELRRTRQKIGMIFQSFNLLSNQTVFENVALPLKIAGWKKEKIQRRVEECLGLLGLQDKIKSYPAQLSGGQKQRVAIANHPEILLADEPTSALDPLTKLEILNALLEINQKLGLTIVIATHEISVIKKICQRVILLKDAKVHEVISIQHGEIVTESRFGKDFVEAA